MVTSVEELNAVVQVVVSQFTEIKTFKLTYLNIKKLLLATQLGNQTADVYIDMLTLAVTSQRALQTCYQMAAIISRLDPAVSQLITLTSPFLITFRLICSHLTLDVDELYHFYHVWGFGFTLFCQNTIIYLNRNSSQM